MTLRLKCQLKKITYLKGSINYCKVSKYIEKADYIIIQISV